MLTRRRTAAGLISAAAAANFLPFTSARGQALPEAPASDEPPTQLDVASDRFEHMLAPVDVNGQGPFQFLIDTGANISCVSSRLAERLSLTPAAPARVHTVVGVRERPSVMIDRLQVGSRHRKSVRAPSLPIKGPEVDGVLGVDWLKGQRLALDFKAKTLEITSSRSESSELGRVVVPARRRMGQLTIVDADLNGRRISAMIDSGSQVTICNTALRQLVAADERRKGHAVQMDPRRVKLETVAGEAFSGEMLYLPFLRLGGLRLGNVGVVHTDMHVFDLWDLKDTPAVILGMDLLTQFNAVALDFGKSQVRFDLPLSMI